MEVQVPNTFPFTIPIIDTHLLALWLTATYAPHLLEQAQIWFINHQQEAKA